MKYGNPNDRNSSLRQFSWRIVLQLIVAVSVNLIVMILRSRGEKWAIRVGVVAASILALPVLVTVFHMTKALWRRAVCVRVPPLDGKNQSTAESELRYIGLQSHVKTQYAPSIQKGSVIPGSQIPEAGIWVPRGTEVEFVVSVSSKRMKRSA
jgi:hypothetical protein